MLHMFTRLTSNRCLLFPTLLILFSCAGNPKVTRIGSDTVTDISGRWNDTDSRMVSEKMIDEMLLNP